MSFTYSVNTDGTVSNVQFNTTEHFGVNITCAEVVSDNLNEGSTRGDGALGSTGDR